MKLYANIIGQKNGELVIKGQGSNQSLTIEVLAEDLIGIPTRSNIYRLSLNVSNDNELEAELLDYSTGSIIYLAQKKYCTNCGNVEAQTGDYCTDCGFKLVYTLDKAKGEKKKGENTMCRHIQKNCPICEN